MSVSKEAIEGLAAALEPFAAVAEHDIGADERAGDFFAPMKEYNRAPRLRVGDLRLAKAALDTFKQEIAPALPFLPIAGEAPDELSGPLQWEMADAFEASEADTTAGKMIAVYDVVRSALISSPGKDGGQEVEAAEWQGRYWIEDEGRWSNWITNPVGYPWAHEPQEGKSEIRYLYPQPASTAHGVEAVAWTRNDLAKGLAHIDGITLRDIKSTVGDPKDASDWREYLGRADDLMAQLSWATSTQLASTALVDTAHDLISDWLQEGVEDLPDDTPVNVNIGGRLIIHNKLGELRSALSASQSTSSEGER